MDDFEPTSFAPSKRLQNWPMTVISFGLWLGISYAMMADIALPGRDGRIDWGVVCFTLLVLSPFPVIGLAFLAMPFRRYRVDIDQAGLTLTPAGKGGRGPRSLRWGEIRGVRHVVPIRGPANLRFKADERTLIVRSDAIDAPLVDVMSAAGRHSEAGGYRLRGHRLDITWHGGETWSLDGEDQTSRDGSG